MKTDTSNKIIIYISQNKQATVKELVDFLDISYQAVARQLKKLVEDNKLKKIGTPPKVFYLLPKPALKLPDLDNQTGNFLEENYFLITPDGVSMQGVVGFSYWCAMNKLPVVKTAGEYIKTIEKYGAFKKHGLISGREKLKNTFGEVFLDKLYYFDFYAIERFGKTKLGTLVAYAKQSQNKFLIKQIYEMVKNKIDEVLKGKSIDAVGFIPPTVKREVQLQKELKRMLDLDLPVIDIIKVKTKVAVPQKSLKRIEDRIANARGTIFVEGNKKYKNILLIDDAVGSGATMNEVAKKIRDRGMCLRKIIGLALVGSFKGFDVVSGV